MKLTIPLMILVSGFVVFMSSGPQPRTKRVHVDMTPEIFEAWLPKLNEATAFSFYLSHQEESGEWYQLIAWVVPRARHNNCSLSQERDRAKRIQRTGPRSLGNSVDFLDAPCDEGKILQVWRLIKEKGLWKVRRVDDPCKVLEGGQREECLSRARTAERIYFGFSVRIEEWLTGGDYDHVITEYGFTTSKPGFVYSSLSGPIPQAMRDIVEYVKKNLLEETRQRARRVTRYRDGKIVERNWDGPGPGGVCGVDEGDKKDKLCPPPTENPSREP